MAHDLLAYAGQLAARPDDAYLPFGRIESDGACLALGPTDPSGFAALGVTETLMHIYDITQGLGIGWNPPDSDCRAVLARLFPDGPAGDPVQVLPWSTGSVDLPGRSRVTSWVMKAAIG